MTLRDHVVVSVASLEQTAQAQQVRAEMGLRGEFAAHVGRLVDVIKKQEQSEFQVCAGFRTEGYPMSKPDEYRANAQECQRMAGISRNPNEKVIWQQMSQHWLRMVPKAEPPEAEQGPARTER